MANGTNKAKIDAGGPSNYVERGLIDTPLKTIYETITTVASADTVYYLQSPPKYATIVDVQAYVTATLGAGTAMKIGDGDDDDRYVPATATTSAVKLEITPAKGASIFYHTGQATSDEQLQATITGTPTADLTVYFKITYTS